MRNKRKLGKMIALALVLGSCSANVTEAYNLYGNSTASDLQTMPTGDVVPASNWELNFDYSSIPLGRIGLVFGGYAINADASSNKVNYISGNSNGICAGYVSGDGNAIGNIINFTDGKVIGNVFGGYVSGEGNANNNELNFSKAAVGKVFGGFANTGNSNNNVITTTGGSLTTTGSIFGGMSVNGDVNNNIVNIGNDMHSAEVYGGSTRYGNSNNNTVNIKEGANNIGWIYVGKSGDVSSVHDPGRAGEYTSNSNKLVVDANASIAVGIGGMIYHDAAAYQVSANDNSMFINSGTINMLTASYTQIDSSKADVNSYIKASNNKITLNGGNVYISDVVEINDVNSSGSSVINNTTPIEISGNNLTINGGVAGSVGCISAGDVVNSALVVKNNSIDIRGGIVQYGVIGGHFSLDNTSSIESSNNTVNWYGGDVTGSIDGYTYSTTGVHYNRIPLSGSTFNFYASHSNGNYNKTISSLGGFENYHFYLDNTVPANTTLINLTGYADLSGSNVGVAVLGSSPLQEGDSVTLLDATDADGSIITSPSLSNDTSYMTETIATEYNFNLSNDGRRLVATLGNTTRNPKAENLMGIRSAEAFMTYDKVDVVDKAYQASKHTSEPSAFIEYGYSDITTKDDTKLRGSNVLWGIASTIGGEKDQANTLTRGIFFEYGDGTVSSIGHYPTGSIYGYGKSKKFGLGVLARKVMFDRHYYDAYLRAGTIKTDYDALAEGVGNIKYDNRDMYFSGNLGYGQFIQLTPNLQMDTYIKYFYNRIPGHSTTAYTNGVEAMPISFDVFENHRFRLGSKFTWDYMESNNYKWYADVALEQEFARDQSGSINSHRISKSNGSSTTGIIELCYENKFGVNDAFMFTAKAQGYVGDRRGLGASANLSFSF